MPYHANPDLAVPAGRADELAGLRRLLDRDAPAHVSVVGPKHIGKTMLLRALAERAEGWNRFSAVARWDVRRHTPASDDEFFAGLARAVAAGLESSAPSLAECLREDPSLDMAQEVFEELGREGARVLLVVDHLDRALLSPGIGKGAWDNLRDLAIGGSLTIVAATPRRLRELTDADVRTSEFWNVFAPPVELGPFSEGDVDLVLRPLEAAVGELPTPARKEFHRQTGGVPLLCTVLAGRLEGAGGPVGKGDVAEAASDLARSSDHVASLWADVPAPAQAVLVEVASRGDEGVPARELARERLGELASRGYAAEDSAGRVAPRAKVMVDHAATHRASAGDLARLFRDPADARKNTQALLELRLEAVAGGPQGVRIDVERAIQCLRTTPSGSLEVVRSVAHSALDAIWDAHFPDRELPRGTVDAWYHRGSDWAKKRARPLVEVTGYRLPSGRNARSEQEKILGLLTDPAEYGEVSVSDGTYRLIQAARALGNYGIHVGEGGREEVPFETAAAACALAVEVFRRLSHELPTT